MREQAQRPGGGKVIDQTSSLRTCFGDLSNIIQVQVPGTHVARGSKDRQ